MEYIQGQTLHDALRGVQVLSRDSVRNVAKAVGSALSFAHAHGILHNDLTPGNIMIGADGVLKLIDFGIASAINKTREKSRYVFGTPSYMSPEQLRCDPVLDTTTDVFSLGVLLHQMMTGLLPQAEEATHEDLALRSRPPVTLTPPAVAAVLDRALAFNPADRYRSVADLLSAFDTALGA
jgi:serine/threonine-protein kinase